MSLFQPTYITPDLRSGLGQGCVDVSNGLTVSWHISGNSALTAFSISVLENTAGSAELYSTGRISDGCPAYGTARDGTMLFFSYEIPASALASAGIVNGNEYKLIVTQWWSETESVTQSSASAFVTRAAPALRVDGIGSASLSREGEGSEQAAGVVGTRYYTFTGSYSQAQGDGLNWFRWRVAVAGNTGDLSTLYDSGNVSGTMDISCYYDGFFTGTAYAVRLTAQTENGVEADTGWISFSVEYEAPEVAGRVTAGCAAGTDAVYVEWSGVAYIPGRASGPYGLGGGVLTLPAGSGVVWDTVNGQDMDFAAPWSVVWRGTVGSGSAELFTVGEGSDPDRVMLVYFPEARRLALLNAGEEPSVVEDVAPGTTITAVLTPEALYLRLGVYGGGLYPSETRYPSETLYPAADSEETAETYSFALDYTQNAVAAVSVTGYQRCDYIELIRGTASAETVSAAIDAGSYTPGEETDWMLADFTGGLNAGNLDVGEDTVEGYALYRRQGEAGVLVHVADAAQGVSGLYDYGAVSQGGPYTYYLFPLGAETYIAAGLASGAVAPCFWNWTLLECAATENDGIFTVLAEYRFRYNVSTGAMSNNNAPKVLQNFTRYPTVQRAPQNYKSGTLTALIGYVDRTDGSPKYVDTISLRDGIFSLPLSGNALFLKNRKGDLLRVRVSEAVTMQTGDATKQQTQTMALAWVETGGAEGVSLYALAPAAQNSGFSGTAGGSGAAPVLYDTADATARPGDIAAGKTAYISTGRAAGTLRDLDGAAY